MKLNEILQKYVFCIILRILYHNRRLSIFLIRDKLNEINK